MIISSCRNKQSSDSRPRQIIQVSASKTPSIVHLHLQKIEFLESRLFGLWCIVINVAFEPAQNKPADLIHLAGVTGFPELSRNVCLKPTSCAVTVSAFLFVDD